MVICGGGGGGGERRRGGEERRGEVSYAHCDEDLRIVAELAQPRRLHLRRSHGALGGCDAIARVLLEVRGESGGVRRKRVKRRRRAEEEALTCLREAIVVSTPAAKLPSN